MLGSRISTIMSEGIMVTIRAMAKFLCLLCSGSCAGFCGSAALALMCFVASHAAAVARSARSQGT